MKSTKQIVSFILAIVILFGTIGWVVSMVVSAETTSSSDCVLEMVYSVGDKSSNFSSNIQYNREDTSNYPNFTIKSGYSADFTITVVDTTHKEIPKDVDKLVAIANTGSFSKISGLADSKIVVGSVQKLADASGITYKITASKLRYSGDGNTLGITVSNGSDYTHNVSLEVKYCVPYEPSAPSSNKNDDDDDDDETKPKTATPYLIVSNYNYGKDIVAGQNFKLNLTFTNTSKWTDIENVMVTLTMPEGLSLTSSSNTFYVTYIESEKSVTKTVEVQAKPNCKAESQQVKVDFKYEYIAKFTRESTTTSETIAIPVTQPDRFSADPIQLSPEVIAGEEIPISVNYINKGRGEIYNVSAEITGNIENAGQRQNIGNLDAGKSGSIDFYVKCNEPGQLSGNVTITYEDINMVIKTVTVPFSATVKDFADMQGPGGEVMNPGEGMPPDGMPQGNPWGKYIVIGGVALLVIAVVVVIVIKKKKAAKKKSDEDEDSDED